MVKAHRELILAWLDGAEIQIKTRNDGWKDIRNPGFLPHAVYRIKPTTLLYTRQKIADDLYIFAKNSHAERVKEVYASLFNLDPETIEII